MTFTTLAAAFLVAVFVTAALIRVLRKIAIRRDWVDRPDGTRKMHARPIPYVGGLAMVGGFITALICVTALNAFVDVPIFVPSAAFWIGGLMVVAVGFYDDIHGLGYKHKFAVQILAALVLIHAGYRFDVESLWFVEAGTYNAALYSITLTMVWIVGIMNAVNLIDGLDGLAGGVVLIAFACLGIVFGIQGSMGMVAFSVIMAGAIAGFLAYNMNPATVFMGDAGSLFLGFVLAAFSLQSPAHADPLIALLVPVVVLGLPVLDTTLSVIRRFTSGMSICAPDNDHIHHRLSQRWTPRRAVYMLYGAAALFGIVAILMAMSTPPVALTVSGFAALAAVGAISQMGYQPLDLLTAFYRRIAVWHDIALINEAAVETEPAVSEMDRSRREDFEEVAPATATATGRTATGGTSAGGAATGDGVAGNQMPVLEYEFSSPSSTISEHSVVEVEESLTSAKLGDETVLLDLSTGCYFGVNEVGTSIVDLIQTPKPVNHLVQELRREFDVESDTLRRDVLGFLQKLHGKKLVRTVSMPHADSR